MDRQSRRALVGSIVGALASALLTTCAPDWTGEGAAPAACNDGKQNGNETDTDCGGPSCKQCVIGDQCTASSDCASGDCSGGTCREPHCSNLIQDQDEAAVDCGGNDCKPCAGSDQCTNREQDENETDIDCGGLSDCDRCRNGDACASDDDCLSKRCQDKVCEANSSGSGGASGGGGAGNEGGQDEGGTAGSTLEAGAPNAGAGGESSTSGGSSSSGGTSNASAGAEPAAAGAAATGGNQITGGQGPTTGGAGMGEGGAAGTDSAGGTATGGTATGGTATGGTATGGTATGGTATGGTATGGNATGGTDPCSPQSPPSDGVITDFSEIAANTTWTTGEQAWGDADLSGTTFTYGSAGTELRATVRSGHDLQLSSTTTQLPYTQFEGFGLEFDTAVNASSYTGLSFTLSGTLDSGTVEIQLRTIRNTPNDETCGTCPFTSAETKWDDCKYNVMSVTGMLGQTVQLPWTGFAGGAPFSSSNASELLGLQIQFSCGKSGSSCAINVVFDNFEFY